MTDLIPSPARPVSADGFADDAQMKRLKKRHRAEQRFKLYGQCAIGASVFALIFLLGAILSQALSAFTRHEIQASITLHAEQILPDGDRENQEAIASNVSGFNRLMQGFLRDTFPESATDSATRRELYKLSTRLAVLPMARATANRPEWIGDTRDFSIALADDLDLFLKGRVTGRNAVEIGTPGRLGRSEDGLYTLSDRSEDPFPTLREIWTAQEVENPSILVKLDESWFSLERMGGAALYLDYLAGPKPQIGEKATSDLSGLFLTVTEDDRTISDQQIAWVMRLEDLGLIKRKLNTGLFKRTDSTYPELAGAAAAIVGSLLTMLITAMFGIPVGILAAVYLEEFAPKNRITSMIEVNINNLAAVPSIVFGLLGAAVFLNGFGMPRSIPLVGGLVLGLLVLPTVIIASRAALKAVPPSIRTAALGLGASKTQAIFHHVLPLAAPGILTGSIIGMARALGETAPLLLIGMVAFVAEIPTGPDQESTVLPVLIYKWSTGAERAWEPITAAAIIILLVFLVIMNLAAVLLRRKFERRW